MQRLRSFGNIHESFIVLLFLVIRTGGKGGRASEGLLVLASLLYIRGVSCRSTRYPHRCTYTQVLAGGPRPVRKTVLCTYMDGRALAWGGWEREGLGLGTPGSSDPPEVSIWRVAMMRAGRHHLHTY